MDAAFLERFRQRLKEQNVQAVEDVLTGKIKDFTEYRYSVGYLKGLRDAETIADQLVKEIQGEK